MRCRGTSAGLLLRRWTAAACLVACALRPVARARAVTGGLATAYTDHEHFRGDFFPELVNPSPVMESEDYDRRRHKYLCTDCVDDQEPDACERRMHEHQCVVCETEPGGSLSTATYKRGGGGGRRRYDVPVAAEPSPRRWPPTAVIGKRRDHRHRVIVPPTRRRHRPVVVTKTKAVVEVTVISELPSSENPLHRVFNVRWNEVIKKTTKITPQRTAHNIMI